MAYSMYEELMSVNFYSPLSGAAKRLALYYIEWRERVDQLRKPEQCWANEKRSDPLIF